MLKRKRAFTVASTAVLLSILLAGCVGGGGPTGPTAYTASGKIVDADSNPIQDVVISFGDGFGFTETDENGLWRMTGLTGKVVATPAKDGWKFEPGQATISSSTRTADFTGFPDTEETSGYRVAGRITRPDGKGIASVPIIVSDDVTDWREPAVFTDKDGYWEVWVEGFALIRPRALNWRFSPGVLPVTESIEDLQITATYTVGHRVCARGTGGAQGECVPEEGVLCKFVSLESDEEILLTQSADQPRGCVFEELWEAGEVYIKHPEEADWWHGGTYPKSEWLDPEILSDL